MNTKYILLLISVLSFFFVSCEDYMPYDFVQQDNVSENVKSIFGSAIDPNHDWKMSEQGRLTIHIDRSAFPNTQRVQILTESPFGNSDANGSTILNEATIPSADTVTLVYDAPTYYTRLYAALISIDGEYFIKGFDPLQTTSLTFTSSSTDQLQTRAVVRDNALPDNPVIARIEASYNNTNYPGWEDDYLYMLADSKEDEQVLILPPYTEEEKKDVRAMVFTYLPNKVSNIEKIRESNFFNGSSYPITTGKEPIVVAPVYKNDGGWKEVEKCYLYYYYFKDSDIEGMSDLEQAEYFKKLPKYKAVWIGRSIRSKYRSTGMADDEVKRETGYTLIYWGDGIPTKGTTGSYQFPKDYKIGFMIKEVNGTKKTGEMYCDGRLNTYVNFAGDFASAKLEETDPRMAWIYANNLYLCAETGADRDFNDVVFEITGGLTHKIPDIDPEYRSYTYVFEDTPIGDYDMNDVILQGKRLDKTHVQWSLIAAGGTHDVYILNTGSNLFGNNEVHALFGKDNVPINAYKITEPPVVDNVLVNEDFSFTDLNHCPSIYNKTLNIFVDVSQKGEDPHGLIIPYDLPYPKESICIKDAFLNFINWLRDRNVDKDWYLYPIEEKVVTRVFY